MRRSAVLHPVLMVAVGGLLGSSGPPGSAATISGVVYDSLAMRGLAGATVQLAEAVAGSVRSQTTSTDSVGRFQLPDVAPGTYLLGFFHAKVDSLAISAPVLRVDVRTDEPIRVVLAVPSTRTIVRAVCGARAPGDSTGLVIGYLRGADNSMPRPGGKLTVRWAELFITGDGIRRETPSIDAVTGPTGLFAICGLPVSTPLLFQASSAADSSGLFEVEMPANGLLHRDAFVGAVRRERVARGDSAPPADMLRGVGRLRGQVVGANGRPIAGARVLVWGTGLEAHTDASGAFALVGLPGGTHTLEVRAVGFFPSRRAVDIAEGRSGSADVELANLGITLDTVKVVAERLYTSRQLADFERRKRSGIGRFIDEDEISKRNPSVMTDLLRMVPGVMVVPGLRSGDDILMRGGPALASGLCRPDILVDGIRVVNDEMFPINALLSPADLRAVEVYARSAVVPAELSSLSGCGVIALWTGPRRRR